MPKSDADTTLSESEVLVIAGMCLGMSQTAAGKWAVSAEFPTGVSDRTVRNWFEAKTALYDRLMGRIAGAFQREKEEFEDLTRSQYRERLEKLRSKSVRVKELALDQAIANPNATDFLGLGVKVADGIENRDLGMAKQVIEAGGRIEHALVWTSQTREELIRHEYDMLDSKRLLSGATADAIEAEVVTDA